MKNFVQVTKKLTKLLNLDLDKVVTDVDFTNLIYKTLNKIEVNFDGETSRKDIYVDNWAVNDIYVKGSHPTGSILTALLAIHFPEQVESKSRKFLMRFNEPSDCAYKFIENVQSENLSIDSNVDLTYAFTDELSGTGPRTYVFKCQELKQHPTLMYVGLTNTLSTDNLHRSSNI